ALHQAAYLGRLEAAQLLLESGAQVERRTYDGKSALDLAQERGHEQLVSLLLNYRAQKSSGNIESSLIQPTIGKLHKRKATISQIANTVKERPLDPALEDL